MFATLSGGLPASRTDPPASVDDLVRLAVEAQDAAGIELVGDGLLRGRPASLFAGGLEGIGVAADGTLQASAPPVWTRPVTVAAWQFAAACTERTVKQTLPGPYSLGRRIVSSGATRAAITEALGDAIRAEIETLAGAGCAFIEIEEGDATEIGDDAAERTLWRDAHERLTAGISGVHLSLAIVGGSADAAGPETIFGAPYASHLFDLVAGPDNWRLITRAPPERGIICGALGPASADSGAELLAWAAHYAAAAGGRGLDRVGLANAPGLELLTWAVAIAKLEQLGRTAALVGRPSADLAEALDPRAISTRSAAAGRYVRRPPRRTRPPAG